ncbi:ATP-binding protein [Candidatus Ruminimicrobiellum ovillum]|uniref:ATP-binding protein n=1 Tax=Candidatus Ruminimicrobiellum ovillum TaxID=1947927 RepID=UPI003559E4E5
MENFKPRARILKLLGEELIGSQHLALFELIKNAYDADADNVCININNVENVEKTTIVVKDNGCGMTLDTIKNSWLEPGTDNKEKLIENKIRTNKYGRFPLGSKGVGRFAAYKLGNVVTLYTKTVKDGELKLSIDLNEVLEKKYLDEFLVNIEKVSSSDSHIETETGTEIIISNITSQISFGTISNLNSQILSIQSPFESYGEKKKKIKNPIKIELICPEYQYKLKTFSIKDIIEEAMYSFNFKFENGKLDYEYNFTPNKTLQKATNINPRRKEEIIDNIITIDKSNPVKDSQYYKSLNKIEGTFYVYDLDGKILNYYQKKSAIKKYTLENCGVRVYREGMRVYNYGEKGNDWLELDQGRIDDPAKNLSNRLIIGGIELDPKTITVLREKTNREGFIEDEEYEKFKMVVKSILYIFNRERIIDKNILKIIADDKYKESITNIQEPILKLKALARQYNAYKEMNKQIDEIEKAYNQMRDIMLNSGLKGLNTAIAVHEIEKTLFRLKRAIENKDSNLIKAEISMVLRLIEGISDLLKKDSIRKYKTSVIIKDVLNLLEDRFKRHNIEIISPILENKKIDHLEINVPKRMVLSSLMNLMDNAIYWLSVRWYKEKDTDKKKIYINAEYVNDNPAIVIIDNGTGFPKGDREELFKPFVTTKPMGMGLGLYYVKTAMDAIAGDVLFLDSETIKNAIDDDGAGVALVFKE